MIANNLQSVRKKIAQAAAACGRSAEDIRLIAVSKRFGVASINEAYRAGQTLFGENYIQELETKVGAVTPGVRFHFIGHLQSNKAKTAAKLCQVVETVDRRKLVTELAKHLEILDKQMDVFIQVNVAGDAAKEGARPEDVRELLEAANSSGRLRPTGLMTMPPLVEDPEDNRIHFRNLRLLAEELGREGYFGDRRRIELSMGMSDDFPVAIAEGATIIRVGTAIFGQRPAKLG